MNIFSGIKIVDLSRVFSGPFATRHFADFGANVIKIEPPNGDDSRNFPPKIGKWSGYFELLNRNKSSLFLDLKKDHDYKYFVNICKDADVLVENYTPGVTRKLGIDYKTINKINKRIIYATISGISSQVNRKYYDVIAQAECGLISLNGSNEDMKIATSVVDAFSGMKMAYAISSALYFRELNGKGQKIEVSMKGSGFDLLEQNLISTSVTNINPTKVGNMDNAIAPFGIFKTKDGSVVLAVGNEEMWEKLSSFLSKELLEFDGNLYSDNSSRLKNLTRLRVDIETVFSKLKKTEVITLLNKMKIPCGQVKTMKEILMDKENFKYQLLKKYSSKDVGAVTVPTGGINFSLVNQVKFSSLRSIKYEI